MSNIIYTHLCHEIIEGIYVLFVYMEIDNDDITVAASGV